MASFDPQPGKHPPATPVYILRGHAASVNALHFYGRNSRLVSGDADGWVIIWNITTKRPAAVWKAHEGAILNVMGFEFAPNVGSRTGNAQEAEQSQSSRETRVFTYVHSLNQVASLLFLTP